MSSKWHSRFGESNVKAEQREFKQVLAQLSYYMNEFDTRYGFVLTDQELGPIRKRDARGNSELADLVSMKKMST